ncbi:FxsA family protein [Sulfurimonas sp. SAG-AH-194-I05]|nr:FxsA family protein [Sulfurimonas sp. SAG-AH-194-I05]MDF1874706.1 FxsA family protein [Sulfurimonas sp. SAG-AH-194-I05]
MLYFIFYIFLEVMVSTNISAYFGGLITFSAIILSAFIGVSILINFRKTLMENMSALTCNCMDLEQFQRLNLFTLFGAILLIVPGFLTDIVGLIMQFSIFTSMLVNRYHVKSEKCKSYESENYTTNMDPNIIDVEVITNNTMIK